jgi:predicted transcriptional regulator
MIHSNSLTRQIVDYIRAHPGAKRPDILSALPEGTKPHSVSTLLSNLAKGGVIVNSGRSGRAASWVPIIIEVDFKFRKIARELLVEMKAIHHSQREEHLALRLQEIFGGQT